MKVKNAQVQQVFIYILTIVVVGLILLIGYKAIGSIMGKGCDVEKTTFKSQIETYITKYVSYGSMHTEAIKAPCGYIQLCFADTESIDTPSGQFDAFSDNPIVKQSAKDGIKDNIFLAKEDVTDAIGYMTEIVVNEGTGKRAVCITNVNGRFKVKFEGQGRTVKISAG